MIRFCNIRSLAVSLLTLVMISAAVNALAARKEILQLGYSKSWNARTMYNPFGRYQVGAVDEQSALYGWPALYEACEGDQYEIQLPESSGRTTSCVVEFYTPIRLVAGHKVNVRFKVESDRDFKGIEVIGLDPENSMVKLFNAYATPAVGKPYEYSAEKSVATSIAGLRLQLRIATSLPYTTVKISDISIYDQYLDREMWIGTPYFNHCTYYNESGAQQTNLYINGRKETMRWTLPDTADSNWNLTQMPVGNTGYMGEVKTAWDSENSNYWIRRSFNLEEVHPSSAYFLEVCHDDVYEIYVNGHLVDASESWTNGKNPVRLEIPWRMLRKGANVIAAHQCQTGGGCFFDCGLVENTDTYPDADPDAPLTTLIATEVTVAQIDQTLDWSNNYGGWIELYNKGDRAVSLDFLFISNDANDLTKHRLSTLGTITPGSYGCIYFDHHSSDGVYGPNAGKQVPFKLKAEGGMIYLSEDGITPFLTVAYPASISRCSYARKGVDSDEWSYNALPTPGAANSDKFATKRLEAPKIDVDSKLFTSSFSFNVTGPAGATIRYTTDGSAPTLSNGATLTPGNGFRVTKTCVYRFCAFAEGYLPSTVVTRSFIRNDKDYYLPVISVTTAPANLYDDYIGVYVDGKNGVDGRNHGKSNINMDWERPVNFEYITPEEGMVINQEANFQVSGGWSRFYLPSSFKIKANKIYEGQNSLDYPFFHMKPYNKYKQIVVRNGGNDNDGNWRGRVRDAITQQVLMSNGFYIDAQDYQPCHVFFNGSYIGMLNIREPNNRFHGTANYGYDDDLMDAYEFSNGYYQMAGTRDAFSKMMRLSAYADDPAIYAQLREVMDMDEYINYMAAECYIGPWDWITNNNNSKGYRSLPDGKFHFVIMDEDSGFGNRNMVGAIEGNYGNDMLVLYNNLKRNAEFRRRFVDAFCLVDGSVYTIDRINQLADSICTFVAPALAIEGRNPWSSYNEQKGEMVGTDARRERMNNLRNVYGLGTGVQVRLDANIPQASLMVNGQRMPGNRFDGTLFPPVTVTASAPTGYVMKGWRSTSANRTIIFTRSAPWRYYDKGSLDGNAWMSADFKDSSWSSGKAPLGYYTGGSRDYNTTIGFGGNESKKYPTYYFRKEFNLDFEPGNESDFLLDYTVDDGYIIYINGVEAARYLMPEGEVKFATYATTYAPNNPDSGSCKLPSSLFRKGRNVIAVEVHNNSATSTDIYWCATLSCISSESSLLTCGNHLVLDEKASGGYTAMFEPAVSPEGVPAQGLAPVRINEISAGNEIYVNEYIKRDDWIELYNTTDEPIDVAGMYMSDNASKPKKFLIPASEGINTVIPPHGFLLVWASKRDAVSQLHASFKLGNTDGSVVMLTAADESWSDTFNYDAHTGQQTYGRYPDGGANIYKMNVPTIMRSNMLSSYDFDPETISFDNALSDYDFSATELIPAPQRTAVAEEYYNLQGQRIARPAAGIYVRRVIYDDGSVMTTKIALR